MTFIAIDEIDFDYTGMPLSGCLCASGQPVGTSNHSSINGPSRKTSLLKVESPILCSTLGREGAIIRHRHLVTID